MTTPNWQKNSGKAKKGKGIAKGVLKARKQSLQHLKRKLKGADKSPFSCHNIIIESKEKV